METSPHSPMQRGPHSPVEANPYSSPSAPSQAPYHFDDAPYAIRQPPIAKAWILFFIVATLGSVVAGALIGGLMGFVLGASGVTNLESMQMTFQVVGFLISLPINFLAFRWSVTRYLLEGSPGGARGAQYR